MVFFTNHRKFAAIRPEQKFLHINLADFKSSSCITVFSYGFLYFNLVISIAVYCVDTFTAVNLLLFDRWSGQVKPVIPFEISRWLFAACIILSLLFLIYRWQRAIRAMKTDSVALSYLDPLAFRLQSMRLGKKGQGWRRFLLFAALTEGRQGLEYVALVTYFWFEAGLRILLADGPRQCINAMTLYTVLKLELTPKGSDALDDDRSPIAQFFVNVRILAESNREQAAVYFGMLFTVSIWAFSALALLSSGLIYITYLWRNIPKEDGSLPSFCRKRIDTRLHDIIGQKIERALAREDKRIRNTEKKSGTPGTESIRRQPTVPILISPDDGSTSSPSLSRHDTESTLATQSTLPKYESRPPSPPDSELAREPTVPRVGTPSGRPGQSRTETETSYGLRVPLIPGVAGMGYGRSSPQSRRPMRSNTDMSMTGAGPRPPRRPPYDPAFSARPPRSGAGASQTFDQMPTSSQRGPPRGLTSGLGHVPPYPGPGYDQSLLSRPSPSGGRHQGYEMYSPRPPPSSAVRHGGGYVAFSPPRRPSPPSGLNSANYSMPRQVSPPIQRVGTTPVSQDSSYHDSIYAAYGGYDDDHYDEPVRRAGAGDLGRPPWRQGRS